MWKTRESGMLPIPRTFEPRIGALLNRFAALHNPRIHPPIPPEVEPDVLTDKCCLRVAQGGIRQVLACCACEAHWVFRCIRMVVVRSPVSVLRYRTMWLMWSCACLASLA